MARKAKRDYKSEKIPVSMTKEYKIRVEKKAEALGISAPALFRLLFNHYEDSGIPTEELLNAGTTN